MTIWETSWRQKAAEPILKTWETIRRKRNMIIWEIRQKPTEPTEAI